MKLSLDFSAHQTHLHIECAKSNTFGRCSCSILSSNAANDIKIASSVPYDTVERMQIVRRISKRFKECVPGYSFSSTLRFVAFWFFVGIHLNCHLPLFNVKHTHSNTQRAEVAAATNHRTYICRQISFPIGTKNNKIIQFQSIVYEFQY